MVPAWEKGEGIGYSVREGRVVLVNFVGDKGMFFGGGGKGLWYFCEVTVFGKNGR